MTTSHSTTNEKMNKFVQNVGMFDLLPKCLYNFSNVNEYDESLVAYMWWGTYLVRCNDATKIPLPFVIVDHLDAQGELYVIKDIRHQKPLLIKKGMQPALFSDSNSNFSGNWYHVSTLGDTNRVKQRVTELEQVCDEVRLLVSLLPLETIKPAKIKK